MAQRTILESTDLTLRTRGIEFALPLRVVSALYGGGVEAGKVDLSKPFRESSIRGHLRFWWRATIGGQFTDPDELRAREGQVWGSTDQASRVSVEVLKAQPGTGIVAKRREGERTVFEEPAYALFPAQSKEPHTIYKRGSFDLRLRFPEHLGDDVDAALRHWLTFGGIGARTRRGLGALYCPNFAGLDKWMNPYQFLGNATPRSWPTMKGARVVWGAPTTWEQAWLTSIRVMQQYRQDRTGPRGRSYWEEPDAIRRLRRQSAPQHSKPMTTEDIFPRAAFGMPIIVHFKTPGDPDQSTIQIDKEIDRMASPVILKPVAINEREAIPVMLALNVTPAPQDLLLRDKHDDVRVQRGNADVVTGLLNKAAQDWRGQVYTL